MMKALNNNTLQALRKVAEEAAVSAGVYVQSRFDTEVKTKEKSGGDSIASQIVTEVDEKAEEIILENLAESLEMYDLGLLTEESVDDKSRLSKDYFWCIDPLDGTLPFTEHRSGYAVSVALVSNLGDPVVGTVYIPDTKELFASYTTGGVFLNHTSLRKEMYPSALHFYMDRSLKDEPYFEEVLLKLMEWSEQHQQRLVLHDEFGGVRNAIGVLQAASGVYLKYPKENLGCGSIWDYAATRLFFEEMRYPVSNASGDRLFLNDPHTTFMNTQGVLYATNLELVHLLALQSVKGRISFPNEQNDR